MTRSGSRAMVNRNRAMAGPKAMKVQPKNTAAVILVRRFGGNQRPAARPKGALSCSVNETLTDVCLPTLAIASLPVLLTVYFWFTLLPAAYRRLFSCCHMTEKKLNETSSFK